VAKVAVWVTNFGNERHIAKCLDSVLAQTFTDYRLFVFDNHSQDGAPAIIQRYADAGKLTAVPMPAKLAGIPAVKFGWDYISGVGAEYSIVLGGHDYWPDPNHLERLVANMDANLAAGNPVALIYSHTAQVNEDGEMVAQFGNFLQHGGNISLPFVPQWIITGIDCTPLFGLWNEKIRRQVPVRHQCAGWDHMVVAHAAIKGAILFDDDTMLVMRAPVPGMSMELSTSPLGPWTRGPITSCSSAPC